MWNSLSCAFLFDLAHILTTLRLLYTTVIFRDSLFSCQFLVEYSPNRLRSFWTDFIIFIGRFDIINYHYYLPFFYSHNVAAVVALSIPNKEWFQSKNKVLGERIISLETKSSSNIRSRHIIVKVPRSILLIVQRFNS